MTEPWELSPEEIGIEYGKWIKDDSDIYSFDVWLAHAAAVHATKYWFDRFEAKTYRYNDNESARLEMCRTIMEEMSAALKSGRGEKKP